MKTKRFKSLSPVFFLLACSSSAYALPVAKLSELFRSQLRPISQAVDACPLNLAEDGSDWEVTTFFLDITPHVAVGIATVLQVQVTPEFEFVWSRDDRDEQ